MAPIDAAAAVVAGPTIAAVNHVARLPHTSVPTATKPDPHQCHPVRTGTGRACGLATFAVAALSLLGVGGGCVKELAADTPNFFTGETAAAANRSATPQDPAASPDAAKPGSAKPRDTAPRKASPVASATPTPTEVTKPPEATNPPENTSVTNATVAAGSNAGPDAKPDAIGATPPPANGSDASATTSLGPLTAPPPRVPTNGAAVVSTGEAGPAAPQVPTTSMAAARDDLISAFFANIEAPVRAAAATPTELANIKLTLMPHWARDVDRPGTVSLQLPFSVKGQGPDRTFFFSYGHEKAGAPKDRTAYKKWLADEKIMIVKVDRQRNGAWYLEGTDPAGHPMFRFQVNYGDKIVYCGGSMYRDPESARLGKLRDDIIIGARQVCASVSL